MSLHRAIAIVLLFAATVIVPDKARAAESYDNCAGTISSLPATISTQGVWCLKGDLSTSITSGNAITIATNNVTIDCNDFKLGGLAAGNASSAYGIYAFDRQNITIRHCNIRGFYEGIYLEGGAGHLVESNRLDNNLYFGIHVANGLHNLVRRNRVFDTGGGAGGAAAAGIDAGADILDNSVRGLDGALLVGIVARSGGAQISDNSVAESSGGLYLTDYDQIVTGNRIVAGTRIGSAAVFGIYPELGEDAGAFCSDNTTGKFDLVNSIVYCQVPDYNDNMSY